MRSLRLTAGGITKRVLGVAMNPSPACRGVLIVTRADIFPPNHGAAVKIDRTAWGLSRLGFPVFLVTDDRDQYHFYLDGRRQSVRYPRWLAGIGPWRRLMRRSLVRAGVPVQDAFLYFALLDWGLLLRAAYVAAVRGIRLFQAEFPAYARVCLWVRSLLGGRTLLVEHNVEFQRLHDQSRELTSEGHDFLVQTEVALCNQVDEVVAVSERDRETLIRHGVDGGHVSVIPHGVDLSSFDTTQARLDLLRSYGVAEGRPVLVYHGTYQYPPNLEAMRILATEILPRLSDRGLDPVVLAIGPCPPAEAIHPNIRFVGSVDSVAPLIKAADVAVVPLRQGGGTRMKVLDYFAAAIPVVSTSKGVEGLGLSDGRQLLVRDGFDSFAEAVANLLCDKERSRTLGSSGRRYAEQLDWLNIARRYVALFGEVPADGRCAS
jgi:glycosyltransferase involved in cell wall biosynthesis